MQENKLGAVREYLKDEFPDKTIDEKYDFDLSAQTFKIRNGRDSLLLKVGENFLSDNNEEQIKTVLHNQAIANLLRENKELGIFVGNNGPSIFKRLA